MRISGGAKSSDMETAIFIIALALVVYLFVTLIRPENF
ncbi:MAG TPA: K(+)-transporting ATPase subunit F [Candidatus Paceibacterota bacterium]|nr:K(+)-transporting ATPase subunit F [Candidatus Paceibacterota bacterium]